MLRLFFAMGIAAPVLGFGAPLKFWHSMSGPKARVIDAIVAKYNATPEGKASPVVAQYVGNYPEGINKVRTALIARRGPHIAQIFDIGTQVMIDSNAIVPLQNLADADPAFSTEELLPEIRRYYEIGGRMYSLPFATSNPIIYYNADAFRAAGVAAPPRTFAELGALCSKLTDPKKQKTCITWPLHSWFFEQFVARQGVDILDNGNGRLARGNVARYASAEGVRFVSLWKELVGKGLFAHVGRGWEPAVHNFMAGRSAMLVTSTSDVFQIAKEATFEVRTAPLFTHDPSVPGGTIVGGNSLWILKRENEAEVRAAYGFVKFMASAEVQETWHRETGYFPIRKDVIDTLVAKGFYRRNPGAWTAIEQLRASALIPATQGALMGIFPQAREHIESAIEEVLAGTKTVEAALKAAETRTNQALHRYNRMRPQG